MQSYAKVAAVIRKASAPKPKPKEATPQKMPITQADRRQARRAMVHFLMEPLQVYITREVLLKLCHNYHRIDVSRIGTPSQGNVFMMVGGRDGGFPFNLTSQLVLQNGQAISFVDSCFGPREQDGLFSERRFGVGPPPEENPFFILGRGLKKFFQEEMGIQIVLTMFTKRPKKDEKEGQHFLEVIYKRESEEDHPVRIPESDWSRYIRADKPDGLNFNRTDLDEKMDKFMSEPVNLDLYSQWSHGKDSVSSLKFAEEMLKMEEDINALMALIPSRQPRRKKEEIKSPQHAPTEQEFADLTLFPCL